MSDFSTYDLTVPAGETRVLQGGGYFRVHQSDGVLLVTFKNQNGRNLAQGLFEEGEWARFAFDQVAVKNNTGSAITCKIRVSKFESGSDQMAGALTVTGDILTPVPVSGGISMAELGGFDGEKVITPGNLSAVFFAADPSVSFAINQLVVVTDVPMAVGVIGTLSSLVVAEGVWVPGGFNLGTAPFGTAGISGMTIDNVAAGTSAIADAAAVSRALGTLPPGRHVMDIKAGAYIPAGSAVGVGMVFKPIGPVACNYAPGVTGLRVI